MTPTFPAGFFFFLRMLLFCFLPVPVEAADLVVLTQPWEASDGRRELLLVSPGGLARYWPDLLSPRRFTDVNARSVTAGQSVRDFFGVGVYCFSGVMLFISLEYYLWYFQHAGEVAETWSQTIIASTISAPSPAHAV